MAARELFRIDFSAHLDASTVHLLSGGIGLPVRSVEDPDADVVGSHFVGESGQRFMVALSRLGRDEWRLEAFTHAARCDDSLVARYHAAATRAINGIVAGAPVRA